MTRVRLPSGEPSRRKRLSAARVKNAKHGKHFDENGLILVVKSTGARSWVQRLTIHGKRYDIGLGGWPWVTLAEARDIAFSNKRTARRGGDPRIAKHNRDAVPTFAEASETVISLYEPTWKAGTKTAASWRSTLATYAFPVIGRKRVSDVDTSDVLAILSPIWTAKSETARKMRNRIGAIMQWSIAEGHRDTDPAGPSISKALPTMPRTRAHHRAIAYAEVAATIEAVRACDAMISNKLAFEFLILTAARSGEVRGALWSEIDTDSATWTVPAERMKAKRAHRVPLTKRALAVLAEARAVADSSGLVFPSARGRVMSDNTISKLLRGLGIDAVPHGFRSSFRDWAGERSNAPRQVMEAALAHTVGNKVEAAYARSDLFEKRRALMDQWAAYLTAEGGTVVPMVARHG